MWLWTNAATSLGLFLSCQSITAPALDGCEPHVKAKVCKASNPVLGTLFLLNKSQLLLLLLSLQVGIQCVQRQN